MYFFCQEFERADVDKGGFLDEDIWDALMLFAQRISYDTYDTTNPPEDEIRLVLQRLGYTPLRAVAWFVITSPLATLAAFMLLGTLSWPMAHDSKALWRQSFEWQGQFFAEPVYLQQHPPRCEFQSLKEAVHWGNSGPHGHCPTPEGQCPQLSTWLLFSIFHRCYEVPTALRQCDGFRWVCGNATGFAYISSGVLYQPLLFLNIGHFGLGGIVWQHIQTLNWIVVSWCVQSGKSNTACSIRGWKSSEWTTALPGMKSRQVTWMKDVATIRRFCESLDAGMLLKRVVFAMPLFVPSFGILSGLPAQLWLVR